MPSRVYAVIVLLTLISEKCNSLRAVSNDVVEDKFQGDLDYEPVQFVEPFKPNKEYDERLPEDVVNTKLFKKRDLMSEDSDKYEELAVQPAKHRRTRQTHHGYTPLYPQVPSAPPSNSYQPYYNPGQNPAYKPPSNPQYQQQWNQNLVNNSQFGNPSSQGYNPHNSSHPYNPAPGPYGQNPGYGRPFPPSNGQYPTATSYPPYAGSGYRPPNSTFHNNPGHNIHPVFPNNFTSHQPPYNPVQYPSNNTPRPNYNSQWQSSGNSTYPGVSNNRPSYNSSHGQYPQYPNSYPQYPTHSRNSTFNGPTQRPPYYPGPNGQNSTPNQHYPTANGQYSSSGAQYPATNGQYPNQNGQYPTPSGQYPTSNGQYPNQNGQHPNPNGQYPTPNGQYPNPNGQYPAPNGQFQGNNNFRPSYPSSNTNTGYKFTNTYNPSIPNYPPHNNDPNHFYYPQQNTTAVYDPRKTPPEHFSYQH